MICKYCGKEIHDGNNFCPFCGKKVALEKEAEISVSHESIEADEALESPAIIKTQDVTNNDADDANVENKETSRGNNKRIFIAIVSICIIIAIAFLIKMLLGSNSTKTNDSNDISDATNTEFLSGVYEDEEGESVWCFADDGTASLTSTFMNEKVIGEYQIDSDCNELTVFFDEGQLNYKYSVNNNMLNLESLTDDYDSSDTDFELSRTAEAPESTVDTNQDSSKLPGVYSCGTRNPIYLGEDGTFLDSEYWKEGTYEVEANQIIVTIVSEYDDNEEIYTYNYEMLENDLILYKVSEQLDSIGKVYKREAMDEEDVRNIMNGDETDLSSYSYDDEPIYSNENMPSNGSSKKLEMNDEMIYRTIIESDSGITIDYLRLGPNGTYNNFCKDFECYYDYEAYLEYLEYCKGFDHTPEEIIMEYKGRKIYYIGPNGIAVGDSNIIDYGLDDDGFFYVTYKFAYDDALITIYLNVIDDSQFEVVKVDRGDSFVTPSLGKYIRTDKECMLW